HLCQSRTPSHEKRQLLLAVRLCKSRRASFNLSHGFPVINFFSAYRTFVKIQVGNLVGFSLKLPGPGFSNPPDFIAAAIRANGDCEHGFSFSHSALLQEMRK